MPKKLKGGPFGIIQHAFCRKTSKKCRGTLWGIFFSKKKVSQCRKKWKGKPLVSPGMVCYAEKQEKPFWFSSLDQIVQFGAIIFCRTFVELFWSVRVDRKKRVTIIVAFHFMKRRLKNITIRSFIIFVHTEKFVPTTENSSLIRFESTTFILEML